MTSCLTCVKQRSLYRLKEIRAAKEQAVITIKQMVIGDLEWDKQSENAHDLSASKRCLTEA